MDVMALSNLSLLTSAVFYLLIGLWWHLQTTKEYWNSKRRKQDFSSTVTFQCCNSCKNVPIEGVFKLLCSVTVCAASVYQIHVWKNASEQNQAIGQLTVFCLFGLSSLCDIISEWCNRILFPGLDYLLLVVCFNVQSVVLSYHTSEQYSWMAIADTCGMYAATVIAISLLLEFKFSNKVWFPVLRSFSTVVLGSWFLHLYVVLLKQEFEGEELITNRDLTLEQNVTISGRDIARSGQDFNTGGLDFITSRRDIIPHSQLDNLTLIPMYFTWHCLFHMNLLTILWLLSWKLADKNCCFCMPEEESVSRFENRVHFDYHMITRMTDSDNEP